MCVKNVNICSEIEMAEHSNAVERIEDRNTVQESRLNK